MSVKVTIPNTGSDYLTFGSANTPNAAQIGGYDDGSSAGHLEFYTTAGGTPTERMRIDSNGNVGIGTSSPSYKLTVVDATNDAQLGIKATNTNRAAILNLTGTIAGYNWLNSDTSGTQDWRIGGGAGTSTLTFCTGSSGAERMRIDSSGNVLVGTNTTSGGGKMTVLSSTSTTWNGIAVTAATASGGGSYPALEFYNNANQRKGYYALDVSQTRLYISCNESGGVYLAAAGTSWVSASDERLKTDLKSIENAAEKVATLRAVTGRYITDEEGTSRSFLIAQDVQAVLPEAVDATDPEKLGVQYTDVIPLLVAAIKELKAEVDSLKAQLEAK